MQILFVTYISAGARSGFVHSRSSMARAALALGLEAWQRCMIPPTFGYIHCTLALVISFTLIVTLNHAAERDTSSEHSLAPPPKKEIRMLRSSSCTLDMKCGQLWLCLNFCHQANVSQHVSVRSIVLPRTKGFTGHYLICGVVPAPTCCAVKQSYRDRRNSRLVSLPPSEITTRTGPTGELGGDSGWDGEGAMKSSKSGRPKRALHVA
jgi:hypothetical protein